MRLVVVMLSVLGGCGLANAAPPLGVPYVIEGTFLRPGTETYSINTPRAVRAVWNDDYNGWKWATMSTTGTTTPWGIKYNPDDGSVNLRYVPDVGADWPSEFTSNWSGGVKDILDTYYVIEFRIVRVDYGVGTEFVPTAVYVSAGCLLAVICFGTLSVVSMVHRALRGYL